MTRRGRVLGSRTVAGRVVKESYGAAKQQHTFTVRLKFTGNEFNALYRVLYYVFGLLYGHELVGDVFYCKQCNALYRESGNKENNLGH